MLHSPAAWQRWQPQGGCTLPCCWLVLPPGARSQASTWGAAHGCRATDHSRWFETPISYRIPYEEGFEPYVLVQRRFVPWYDERFKGYRKNKVCGWVGERPCCLSALLGAGSIHGSFQGLTQTTSCCCNWVALPPRPQPLPQPASFLGCATWPPRWFI
jgi:hypothetical protein